MAVIPEDVATTLLRPVSSVSEVEAAAWVMWIKDASRQIRNRLGDLDALDQDDLDFVIREAVALKAKRPDEASQVDVSVDDARVSRRYERSTGQVTILDEWWAMLSPALDSAVGFSTRPAFEMDGRPLDSWA